jgi:hypothetical protein
MFAAWRSECGATSENVSGREVSGEDWSSGNHSFVFKKLSIISMLSSEEEGRIVHANPW